MFESLKRLFRRRAPLESESDLQTRPHDRRQFAGALPASGPADEQPTPAVAMPSSDAAKDLIQVSLRAVVLKLPETLKGKVKQPPAGGVRIGIPIVKILPQLSQGSIRISFGELRKTSPPGVFLDASDRDHTLVDLPLQEILQQLKPEQIQRRTRQRRVEVPDEVVPIFSQQRGQSNVRIAKTTEPSRTKSELPSQPIRTAPTQAKIPPTGLTHHAPTSLRIDSAPPQSRPSSPSHPAAPIPTAARPVPASSPSTAKPVALSPTPTPSVSSSTQEYISVPLASVTMGWPEAIRQALAGLNAADAMVNLPAAETEQALKRGKVVFPWKRLKPLVRPPLKTALSPALDDQQLELPLSAVAPLFLAQRKPASVQRKYAIGDDIPDVFSARGLVAAHTPAAPSRPAPLPVVAEKASGPAPLTIAPPTTEPAGHKSAYPVPALASAPVAPGLPAVSSPKAGAGEPHDIGEVFGQPGRQNWAPAEIAQRTATLAGVAGAVITMQDGLLIAGELPAGLNGEIIAAFVPQMFTRMMQYSKELKFGESDNITFIIDNVPLRIYRAGTIYFAALGRASEPLPDKPLRLIAAHLGPQSK